MNHLTKLFAIVTALLICGIGNANDRPQWVELGYGAKGKFYIEKNVRTWNSPDVPYIGTLVMWDFKEPQVSGNGATFKSSSQLILIDCKRTRSSLVEHNEYSQNMGMGRLVDSGKRELKEAKKDLKKIDDPAVNAIANFACKAMGKPRA